MLPTQSDLTFWNQKHVPQWASRIVTNVKRDARLLKSMQDYRTKNPGPVVTIDAVVNSHVPREPTSPRDNWKHNTVALVRIARNQNPDLPVYLLQVELDPGLGDRQANLVRQALVRRWRKRIIRGRKASKADSFLSDWRDFIEL